MRNKWIVFGIIVSLLFSSGIICAAPKEDVTFYHCDALGTPVAMTNMQGNVVWRGNSLPFGEDFSGSGSRNTEIRYTGKPYNPALGLYDLGARYYDPNVGRFTSTDPVMGDISDPQRLNSYAYGLNSPYKYVDPDGRANIAVATIGYGDEGTFKGRAVNTGYTVINSNSGQDLLAQLANKSSHKDPINNMKIFSHAYGRGVIMQDWQGLYIDKNTMTDAEGAAYLSDLQTSIQKGEIVFGKGANIILLGCNLATGDFASKLSEITGATVIASEGSVSPIKETKKEGIFSSDVQWKKYQRGKLVEELGKSIKAW